ncbi:MAG: hypothetical protein ACRELF_19175 [Gemmataceae bacterium]
MSLLAVALIGLVVIGRRKRKIVSF